MVKDHQDIAADGLLHHDSRFGRKQIGLAVDVTFEVGAGFVHRSGEGQRENLKSAGVGQHRAIPVHEAVDAAEFLENFEAGAKHQMIGIG